MLKDILKEKGLSVYKVSKETGIPYSTLCDMIAGNTLIERTSSSTLYRLAKYLEMSMEQVYLSNSPDSVIYLYNEGSTIYIEYQDYKMQFKGPKNLVAFKKVNRLQHRMICADTYFWDENNRVYVEEEYVDLEDVFNDYGILHELPQNIEVKIGMRGTSNKERIMDEAIVMSDSMVVSYSESSSGEINVLIVNLNRTNQRMLLEIPSYEILHTNMSQAMQKRAIEAVKRNQSYVMLKANEVKENA